MPIVRSGTQLIYFAHVPKCAGSAVEDHLVARFGAMALRDTRFLSHPPERRWSKTSPQHVDAGTLARLFPAGFFDLAFAVVRHPVSRIVSAWHFQLEVERTVPNGLGFSDWLEELPDRLESDPFLHDNHTRPMDEMVPEGAEIFHVEHDLNAIVHWLDLATGRRDGPRGIGRSNPRGGHGAKGSAKVTPDARDLDIIAGLYARDFDRFGYRIDAPAPLAPPRPVPPDAAPPPPRRAGMVGQLKRWMRP